MLLDYNLNIFDQKLVWGRESKKKAHQQQWQQNKNDTLHEQQQKSALQATEKTF